MAKFIQLELAFVGAQAPAPAVKLCSSDSVVSDTCDDFDAMALRQGIDLMYYGPCKSCPLQGLCDADDCAMKCFKLDSDRKNQGSWDGYFERQRKQVQGWLESHSLTL